MNKLSLVHKCFIGIFLFLYLFLFLHFVVGSLDENNAWSSFIYFYGFGVCVYIFFSWVLIRLGGIQLQISSDRRWFALITVGFVCMSLVHAVWIILSIYSPYKGF